MSISNTEESNQPYGKVICDDRREDNSQVSNSVNEHLCSGITEVRNFIRSTDAHCHAEGLGSVGYKELYLLLKKISPEQAESLQGIIDDTFEGDFDKLRNHILFDGIVANLRKGYSFGLELVKTYDADFETISKEDWGKDCFKGSTIDIDNTLANYHRLRSALSQLRVIANIPYEKFDAERRLDELVASKIDELFAAFSRCCNRSVDYKNELFNPSFYYENIVKLISHTHVHDERVRYLAERFAQPLFEAAIKAFENDSSDLSQREDTDSLKDQRDLKNWKDFVLLLFDKNPEIQRKLRPLVSEKMKKAASIIVQGQLADFKRRPNVYDSEMINSIFTFSQEFQVESVVVEEMLKWGLMPNVS